MMKKLPSWSWALLCLALTVGSLAYAETEILFSSRELDAAFTLMRPELTKIDITGRSGRIDPAPGFKYLGMNTVTFDMDLKAIGNILDLKFNHVRNKPFQVQFQDQGFMVSIPVEDQDKAIQSTLGSISFQGVTLSGFIGVTSLANGDQKFVVKDVSVTGQLKGTGVLKGKLILDNVRKLLVKTVSDQFNRLIDSEKAQDTLYSGLLTWAKFYTGGELGSILSGTLHFDKEGIHYSVQ